MRFSGSLPPPPMPGQPQLWLGLVVTLSPDRSQAGGWRGCWCGRAGCEGSQAQSSPPEPEPTPLSGKPPPPRPPASSKDQWLPCLPPAERQEAPSDQAWTAAQWAFGHLFNGLQGWEVTEHWTWKGPQRSDGPAPPFSPCGGLLASPGLLECCFSHRHACVCCACDLVSWDTEQVCPHGLPALRCVGLWWLEPRRESVPQSPPCFRSKRGSALESLGITLVEEIQEGSLEEVALKAGLGSEEHRGGEAEWKKVVR